MGIVPNCLTSLTPYCSEENVYVTIDLIAQLAMNCTKAKIKSPLYPLLASYAHRGVRKTLIQSHNATSPKLVTPPRLVQRPN